MTIRIIIKTTTLTIHSNSNTCVSFKSYRIKTSKHYIIKHAHHKVKTHCCFMTNEHFYNNGNSESKLILEETVIIKRL